MSSTSGNSKSSDGVPRWNGEAASFQEFEEQCLVYEQSVEYHKRYMVAPRVIAELQGTAKRVITGRPANWVSYSGGLTELLNTLRASLGKAQVSEIADFLNKYFKGSRRRPGEQMGDYIVRKTEAYLRAQQALQRVLATGTQAGDSGGDFGDEPDQPQIQLGVVGYFGGGQRE